MPMSHDKRRSSWGVRVLCCERPALSALSIAISALGLSSEAQGQTCPAGPVAVDGTHCTVAESSTINVTNAGIPGLSATNPNGFIEAPGLSLILGAAPAPPLPRNFIGAQASSGGIIALVGGAISTLTAGTGQRGLVATGNGSAFSVSNATITIGNTSTASDLIGASAISGASIALSNTILSTEGTGNGIGNHGLVASGSGSTITMNAGSVGTKGRGSFGVLAQDGGFVDLFDGAAVSTTGIQVAATSVGSHALYATGSGSRIEGNGILVNAGGNLANGARAEGAGTRLVLFGGSTVSTSGSGNKLLVNPQNAAAMAVGGAAVQVSDSTLTTTTTNGYNHGVMAQGAGSTATVASSSVTTNGPHSVGLRPVNGGAIAVQNSTILTKGAGGSGAWAEGAGAKLDVTGGSITVEGNTAYGVRANSGATVGLDNLSLTTKGLDGSAIFVGGSTVTAKNLTILTTGNDNAMGVLADGGSNVTVTGGSVTTTGSMARAGARPHGVAARNPGGQLAVNGTPVHTLGNGGMGVVADDGGTVTVSGSTVKTEGTGSLGIFSVVEQAGAQFEAKMR